jgi:hypothetical protein
MLPGTLRRSGLRLLRPGRIDRILPLRLPGLTGAGRSRVRHPLEEAATREMESPGLGKGIPLFSFLRGR